MSTTTFTVRCTVEQKRRWHRAAEIQGLKFNAWVKSALSEVATEVFMSSGEPQSTADDAQEWEKPVVKNPVVKKSASSGCDHAGYENFVFCYRCGARTK